MNENLKITIYEHGEPSVLKPIYEPLPEIAADEVLVKIHAAGVGYSDVMAQRGGYPLAPKPPLTPGYDFAGTIERLGESASGLNLGDRVVGLSPELGCYSRYLCIPKKYLVPFPEHLDPAHVCSLVLNYLTAYSILYEKANIKAGQTILVHSAAGGVGSALIQLARLSDIKVYGTASIEKHEFVESIGAIPIDYKSMDFKKVMSDLYPEGIDAAFDPIGGANLRKTYSLVKKGGTVVSYGFAGKSFGGYIPMILGVTNVGMLNIIPDGKRVRICALPAEVKRNNKWYRLTLSYLIRLLDEGKIEPRVSARFSLKEAYKAHEAMENGSLMGKAILECD
ncbi:hypothetical protein BGL48_03790 [Salinivibrio sp. SS3]|uniref:medium chain dehydrogenase/reductase family protein n=1 Tax=Salinivibrio TaxID=51366 RepID=UPI00084804CE|nr:MULTISPECIES: medium chain dehydrogenase/reductase family protein [Salinivibrio]ODP96210.1 hypothetical protein BGL48_03790 [Salinivibrio sp. BNH]WBA13288.1 medium chain dehydrogenase/reductase family protein [Salinivibrio kushneri]